MKVVCVCECANTTLPMSVDQFIFSHFLFFRKWWHLFNSLQLFDSMESKLYSHFSHVFDRTEREEKKKHTECENEKFVLTGMALDHYIALEWNASAFRICQMRLLFYYRSFLNSRFSLIERFLSPEQRRKLHMPLQPTHRQQSVERLFDFITCICLRKPEHFPIQTHIYGYYYFNIIPELSHLMAAQPIPSKANNDFRSNEFSQ